MSHSTTINQVQHSYFALVLNVIFYTLTILCITTFRGLSARL